MGRLAKIDHAFDESGGLTIRLPAPTEPWAEVNLDLARFVVRASEEFFEDLNRIIENKGLRVSRFFRRVGP
jgi:hypothetical protein